MIVGIIIGLVIGVPAGLIGMSLFIAGKKEDKRMRYEK